METGGIIILRQYISRGCINTFIKQNEIVKFTELKIMPDCFVDVLPLATQTASRGHGRSSHG